MLLRSITRTNAKNADGWVRGFLVGDQMQDVQNAVVQRQVCKSRSSVTVEIRDSLLFAITSTTIVDPKELRAS